MLAVRDRVQHLQIDVLAQTLGEDEGAWRDYHRAGALGLTGR